MWRVETVFLEFQRFERKFPIFVLKKTHFHIRTKNVLPISDFRHIFFVVVVFVLSEFQNIKMHDFWSPHNKKVPAFMLEFRLIFVQKEAINIVNVFFSCGFSGVKIFRVSFFYEHEYIRQISNVRQFTFVFLCQLYILDEKIIEIIMWIQKLKERDKHKHKMRLKEHYQTLYQIIRKTKLLRITLSVKNKLPVPFNWRRPCYFEAKFL